jgi:hypothetical protein
MTAENALSRDRIRALNDAFRRSFAGGTVVVTASFNSLSADRRHSVLGKIRSFDTSTKTTIRTVSTTSASSRTAMSGTSGRSTTTTQTWS